MYLRCFYFFFSSRRRHTRCSRDWSSDVCSSDLDLAPYMSEIRAAAERYALPEALISAVIRVESGFNPRAVSRKGARGLMQLMPSTASILGVRNSFDPGENIDGGARHLRGLIERFSND